jgi:hypothetical protein
MFGKLFTFNYCFKFARQRNSQYPFSVMKLIKNSHRHSQFVSSLVLTGILSLGAGITLMDAATSAPKQAQPTPGNMNGRPDRNNKLPAKIANAVRQDLSRQQNIPLRRLRIIKAERKTWPDPCLGVSRPDELCAQVRTEGWQVVVSDGSREWIYRTDSTGKTVRMPNTPPGTGVNVPGSVGDAVKRDLSKRLGVPADVLLIVKAERREWPNGCLGINKPDVMCTEAIVPGWEVTVVRDDGEATSGQEKWVYRTNDTGSVVVFDESASNIGDAGGSKSIKATQIPAGELPPALAKDEIFRAISSGGFAGRTYTTILKQNGRVVQVELNANGATTETEIRRLSTQQVKQFQKFLEQQRFSQFKGLNYPAVPGSADFITVTFTGSAGTTRYADSVQDQLPRNLQEIILVWNQIATR